MFRWAEKRQPWRRLLIDGNPAELVEIAKVVEAMVRDYEAADDKRSAVRPVEPETQAALWLCLSTLCRIGELLMTEWRHVDFEAGTSFEE